jgi:general secretion pathway protein L
MSVVSEVGTLFSLWIDAVARSVSAMFDRFESARRILMIEDNAGGFTLQLAKAARNETLAPHRVQVTEGVVAPLPREWMAAFRDSRVDLVLRPSRFLFRPLDLPKRAAEFLDGIVRAQIDRLTPWNAADAVFHWTHPVEVAGERVTMTVVATARAVVAPLVESVADLGAAIVEVSTDAPELDGARVKVFTRRSGGQVEFKRVRALLLAAFVLTGIAAAVSAGAAGFVAGHYDDQKRQIQRKIMEHRAAIRAGQTATGNTALELLEKRKHTSPSSVMVVEALSALLPDHTYATELRIEGEKLQVIGITRDAPSLIQALEQSPHFSRATFFAPTTRAPNEPGERFHIEAQIRPNFGSGT